MCNICVENSGSRDGSFSPSRVSWQVFCVVIRCPDCLISTRLTSHVFPLSTGHNYTHRLPPMQPLSALIPAILQQVCFRSMSSFHFYASNAHAIRWCRQAGLSEKVEPEECQLLMKGKALDASTPVRYVARTSLSYLPLSAPSHTHSCTWPPL